MRARELMTENPTTVASDATTWDAVELLQSLEIRHLPVVDGDTLVGILSDRDLDGVRVPMDRAILDQEQVADRRPVSELMSGPPITTDPESSAREVAEQMLEHRVGAIPVVDPGSGDLLGIVSYVDVLRGLLSQIEED